MHQIRPALFTLLLALAAFPAPALSAQDRAPSEVIGSDRPGLGDGAHVVGTGVWQFELGLAAQGPGDTEAVGSALVRRGLAPLELRFYLPSPILSEGDDRTQFGDLGVGVKAGMSEGERWRWSAVGGLTLPTGSDAATADDPTAFVTLVGETALSERIAFALNLGYASRFDAFDDGTLSLIATPSLALGDGLSAYAGYAGFFAPGPDAHFLEGGLALASRADVQLDVNGGWDVDSDAWFAGLGVAIRRR